MSVQHQRSTFTTVRVLAAQLALGTLLSTPGLAAGVQDLKVAQTVNLNPFCSTAISADGQYHARSKKGSVEVVSLTTGKALWRIPLTSRSACLGDLTFTRDGLNVIGIDSMAPDDLTAPAEVFYLNARTGKITRRFFIEDTLHTFVTTKTGMTFLGSFAADGILGIDVETTRHIGGVRAPQNSPILQLQIQRGSRVLAFIDFEGGAFVVNTDETSRPSRLGSGTPTAIALSPTSQTVMVGTRDGMIEAFDITTQQRLWTRKVGAGPITQLTYNVAGTKLVAGHQDGTVTVMDKAGAQIRKLKIGSWTVTGLAVSDDGRQLAVTTSNVKGAQGQGTLTLFKTSGGLPVLR